MANGTAPAPLPPELVELLGIITSGVSEVAYGDRRIKYAALGDLLKAWSAGAAILGLPGGGPVRRVACFSKGLDGCYGGIEHAEQQDALFSRQVRSDPMRTTDVDWERGR